MPLESISATQAIKLLADDESKIRCVDVRSAGEVLDGALPGFANIPILDNEERHQVGLCYKNQGASAAIELGQRLVGGHRHVLIEAWCQQLKDSEWPLIACWRGGLRSATAAEWVREAGQVAIRIEGGYKSLRKELLQLGSGSHSPPLFVISGPTGSGKTRLLEDSKQPSINLEGLAQHRGSAFGSLLHARQPSQATFENAVAWQLYRLRESRRLFVEDESTMIGQVHLPAALKEKMNHSPVVRVRMPIEARVENILADYVLDPAKKGASAETLSKHYEACLTRIHSKLGGLSHAKISKTVQEAFANSDMTLHRSWIHDLLEIYYDKTYLHSETRITREIAFEGDWSSCLNWMQAQFA